MRSLVGWGLLPLALGCSFDATGVDTAPPSSAASMDSNDEDDSTSAAPGTSTSGAPTSETPTTGPEPEVTSEPVTTGPQPTTEPATSEPMTTEPETTDPSTTSTTTTSTTSTTEPETTDPSTTSTTTGEPETTGPPACDNSFKQILLVKDAQVEAPMKAEQSMFNEGTVAYSNEMEKGSVTFTFDLPCTGPVAVWGRVLDVDPGANGNDPDSYYVSLDGQQEIDWGYGCQSNGQMSAYFWLRVYAGTFGQACNLAMPWMLDLDAGTHTIRLRNREPKSGTAVAAVARMLVTTDLGYTPSGMD